MRRDRRGFIWISIALELSLMMGVVLYGMIYQDRQVNEGGLVQSTEVDSSLPVQEEEAIAEEDDPPVAEGGPYVVAPVYHASTYRARSGDNLWTVAEKNGLDFYTILSVNRLKKANEISIGQELKIPNQRGILHTLEKGETLEDIALKYNVSIRKIIRVNQILDPNEVKERSDIFIPDAKITLAFSRELLSNSGVPPQFAWPCRRFSRISSRFGYRKDPFTGQRAFHYGLDLAPGYGANTYASMSGVVTYAGWMGGYGRLVVIKHSNGYSTRYGHLSRIRVKKGQYVRQGQQIGNVGNTGRSKGAHLHFEIRRNDRPVNPSKFISVKVR